MAIKCFALKKLAKEQAKSDIETWEITEQW